MLPPPLQTELTDQQRQILLQDLTAELDLLDAQFEGIDVAQRIYV